MKTLGNDSPSPNLDLSNSTPPSRPLAGSSKTPIVAVHQETHNPFVSHVNNNTGNYHHQISGTPNERFNLAAFRSTGLGLHGFHFSNNFGYRDHSSGGGGGGNYIENLSNSETLNLSQDNYRKSDNNSPVNLYLGESNSNSSRDGHIDEYYYNQNIRNNKEFVNSNNNSNNNENNIISRENSPLNRTIQNSDSPDLHNNRSSPVESNNSYPSQKSEEPENSSVEHFSRKTLEVNVRNNHNIGSEMLEHKFPISFLGQPLAALHSMTEMKNNSQSTQISHSAPNPHGIDTILSRPPPVTSSAINALAGGKSLYIKYIFRNFHATCNILIF